MRRYTLLILLLTISVVTATTYEIQGTETLLNETDILDNLIEKAGSHYYFILNDLEQNQDITLILPEGAILTEEKIITPKETSLETNGRQIIITWKNIQEDQIIVLYEFRQNERAAYIILGTTIIILLAISIIYIKKKSKNLKRTQNLFEDEKRIINYLLKKKNKESWTKEISKNLDISKVKLSRKLRSLEAKELIKKIPYGNENKIRLI